MGKTLRMEETHISEAFDYNKVHNLPDDELKMLLQKRPHNLKAAANMEHITPSTISILAMYVKNYVKK